MCSTEGSDSTCMNYYVPLQDDETPPLKKKCASSVLPARRVTRILGRRYALTATWYKYMEIGINVGPPSYIEIVIGDHRGNELILSLETWKGLCELWRTLLNCFEKDRTICLSVGPSLKVRFTTLGNTAKLIHLESPDVCLMMSKRTLLAMFNLDRCVDIVYDQLVRLLDYVDGKFTQFSDLASTVPKNENVSNVIRESAYFNENQLVDCELLAIVFNKPL